MVRAYEGHTCYEGVINQIQSNGTLLVQVGEDMSNVCAFHPKQCRRLVKAKPRRRVWLWTDEMEQGVDKVEWLRTPPHHPEYWTEFVEVKRKKRGPR